MTKIDENDTISNDVVTGSVPFHIRP
jgi:hypothetical protein